MTITVGDGLHASARGSFQLDVVNVAPIVPAGPSLGYSPGIPVNLTSSFTDLGFPVNGSAETYSASIDWGDGTTEAGTITVTPGSAGVPTSGTVSGRHVYAAHGDYTVKVTVLDNLGQPGSGTVLILDTPPTVSAGSNQAVDEGSPVHVAATFTVPGFVAGATAATYPATIDWGDGTTSPGTVSVTPGRAGVATIGTVSGSHLYADPGQYRVTVAVSDAGGATGSGSFTAAVRNVGPTLAPLPDGVYVPGQLLTIIASFTEPGVAHRSSAVVDWGDGTIDRFDAGSLYQDTNGVLVPYIVEPTATNPGRITLVHIYDDSSPRIVTVTVTDEDGLSSTASAHYVSLTQTSTTVTSSIAGDRSIYGQQVTFTATVSSDSAGPAGPSGTVQFYIDGASVGTPVTLVSGSASFVTSQLGAGGHTIRADYSGGGNDLPGTASLTFQVDKARLTVTAFDQDMARGDTLPTLAGAYRIEGFVNGDTAGAVGGSPALSTAVTTASPAGRYPITVDPGSLSAANYTFDVVPATLTVHPRVIDIRVHYGTRSMSLLGLNRVLPFSTIHALDVIFSDDVDIDASDLMLTGINTLSYGIGGFRYDPSTHGATWTLPTALGVDRLMLALDGTGAAGVRTPGSGIGLMGDVKLGFDVLPGDFNGDGVVTVQDGVAVMNQTAAGTPYLVWADIDGDGSVNLNDYLAVRSRNGKKLPRSSSSK